MFDDFGANTQIEILPVGHTTSYDDPQTFWKWIWPRLTNSGKLASENDVNTAGYADKTFETDGYYLRFDQRAYTTEEDFWRANLDINGNVYIPKRCADGSVASCKLNVLFFGCGKKYGNWFDVLAEGGESEGWGANGMIGQDFGFGASAHANDQIILIPSRRDACYDMGAKEAWTMGYNNDPNNFNKEGK